MPREGCVRCELPPGWEKASRCSPQARISILVTQDRKNRGANTRHSVVRYIIFKGFVWCLPHS